MNIERKQSFETEGVLNSIRLVMVFEALYTE
jgi:hypothetical protein